jgi:hypothetical protein
LTIYYNYIYGISLKSEHILPGLPISKNITSDSVKLIFEKFQKKPDLTYLKIIKSIPLKAPLIGLEKAEFIICDDEFSFNISYVYDTCIVKYSFNNKGNNLKISYYPPEKYKKNTINLLYHPVMSYIARLHHRICLHANVININGNAIAFMGESGSGKSTISSALWKKGYPLLSDDVGALIEEHGEFLVWPGQPRLRIDLKTANTIFPENKEFEHCFIHDFDNKNPKVYLGSIPEKGQINPIPMKVIYILKPRNKHISEPVIKDLLADEALVLLVSNTTATEIMTPNDKIQEFRFLTKLVKTIPVKTIECPDSIVFLDKTADIILNNIFAQEFKNAV